MIGSCGSSASSLVNDSHSSAGCCADEFCAVPVATSAAAPAKNPRRPREVFLLFIDSEPYRSGITACQESTLTGIWLAFGIPRHVLRHSEAAVKRKSAETKDEALGNPLDLRT